MQDWKNRRLSIVARIRGLLDEHGGALGSKEIASVVGASHETVKVELSRHNGKRWYCIGENKNAKWSIHAGHNEPPKQEVLMIRGFVRLHRDGEKFAISTNAETERDFLDGLAAAFDDLQDDAKSFRKWLPLAIDIACKIRGYKSEAIEKRVIIAGSWMPDEEEHIVGLAGGLD